VEIFPITEYDPVKVSTPSVKLNEYTSSGAANRLASRVAAVKDPVTLSLVVNGAVAIVKSFPV
jgi:hypothetical protein